MLSIGKLVSARYYLDSVAKRIEDYYAGVGEAPGLWLGQGSRSLGLGGEVAEGDLEPLLAGHGPDGTPLVSGKAAAPGRLPGFDLTFSSPKSVTLLFAIGDPRVSAAARGAHDQAVRQALGYLEAHAVRVRRGTDGVTVLRADGLVGAGFRHRTSRAGDPQLHTHVLVMNMARGPDGRYSALDGTALYAHARTAGFLYQAALRAELTATLGVGWGPVRRGVAEVAGFTTAELAEFSRRRAEIDERMATLGTTSPRGAQVAALDTRQAKQPAGRRIAVAPLDQVNAKDYEVEPPALLDDWRRRARAIGLDDTVIASLTGPGRVPAPLDLGATSAALLGPEGLTAYASTFDRRDVLRGLAERAAEGATVAELEGAADKVLARPGVVRLDTPIAAGQRIRRADGRVVPTAAGVRYTTADLLAVETQLLEQANARTKAHVAVARPDTLEMALAARPALSDEQRAMVTRLVTSGAGVEIVVGAAGTGKTFALDAARAAWQASGVTVIGAALSARAAAELQSGSGIESTTIARLLKDAADPRGRLGFGTAIVVDEAAMVGTRTLARLVTLAEEANAKLVLVGDPLQLPEIDAGGSFRALATRLGATTLVDNRRQSEGWERAALADLRAGRTTQAITTYDDHRRIHLAPTAEAAMLAMTADWWAARHAGSRAVMIAARRSTIAQLNTLARSVRVDAGEVRGPEVTVGERGYAVGDEVIGLRNDRRLGIVNGDIGTVTSVDPEKRAITITLAARRNRKSHSVVLPPGYTARNLDLAYALTAYKAQGLTVDRTFSLGDDTLSAEAGYTVMSRGRASNDLYWVAPEPAEDVHERSDPFSELRRAFATSRAQVPATAMLGEVAALAATRTLDDLEREQGLLGIELLRAIPADVTLRLIDARRLVTDNQTRLADTKAGRDQLAAQLADTPLWRRRDLAGLSRRVFEAADALENWAGRLDRAHQHVRELEAAQDARQAWIDANAPRLTRHAQLGAAIARRQSDLVTAATLRTPRWLADVLGPYPDSPAERRVWRHHARDLLGARDRGRTPTQQPQVAVDARRDQLGHGAHAGADHGPDIGL